MARAREAAQDAARDTAREKAREKKPTIRVVAARAGVAVSTVSRYLNGDYVSASKKARLSSIIASLGYSRSSTARNLSLGRKGCIGVVVDSIEDPWFTQLLTGMEEELQTRDTSLMLLSLELRDRYDPAIAFEWIRDRRVDGLIIAKCHRRERPLIDACLEAQLPLIAVAPDRVLRQVPAVRADNVGAGRLIAAHLADLGHVQIAFAGGPRVSVESRQRLQGLRDGLRARGLDLPDAHVTFCASYEPHEGAAFAREMLRKPVRVTALVLGSDALAIGFMRAAHQQGLRIPDDLSVAGFDGIPEGARMWPGVTTVAQPMREMGREACRLLFAAIAAPASTSASGSAAIEHSMSLIVRESTSAPRRSPAVRRLAPSAPVAAASPGSSSSSVAASSVAASSASARRRVAS